MGALNALGQEGGQAFVWEETGNPGGAGFGWALRRKSDSKEPAEDEKVTPKNKAPAAVPALPSGSGSSSGQNGSSSRSNSGQNNNILSNVRWQTQEPEQLTPKPAFQKKLRGSHWVNVPYTPQGTSEAEKFEQKKAEIYKAIGEKAQCRFKTFREAFRNVDLDKSGTVNKAEISLFFEQFNLPPRDAQILFDELDQDKSGELDYVEFMEHFGPIIQPGCSPPRTYKTIQEDGDVQFNNVRGWSLRKLG